MAGIKKAMESVIEHRNIGKVIAQGVTRECNCDSTIEGCTDCCKGTPYIIVRLEKDEGMITIFDSGSDVRIQKGLNIADRVILMILDNWTAEWQKLDKTINVPTTEDEQCDDGN